MVAVAGRAGVESLGFLSRNPEVDFRRSKLGAWLVVKARAVAGT